MKIRHDAVAVSSILFTVAFLMLTPPVISSARSTHQTRFRNISSETEAAIPGDQVVIPNHRAPLGIASLAIIAIGLVVTWAGYIKVVRWTWFVMFVIVWLWAFPVLMIQYFYPWIGVADFSQSLASTIRDSLHAEPFSSMSRAILETFLIFLLMLLGLVLPAKTFVLGRRGGGPGASGRTNPGAPDKPTSPEI